MNNVNQTVINEYHADTLPGSHGITIYFPSLYWCNKLWADVSGYKNGDLDFQDDTGWDEFLTSYDKLCYIVVDCDGTADFTTIQAAIDNASENDMIYVHNGTYIENIVINKPIFLIAEYDYPNRTIIDGNKSDDVIKITSDGVKLCGFIIQNSSDEAAGIKLYNDSVVLFINWFCYNNIGIYLKHSSNNYILSNYIYGNDRYGLFLDSSNNNYIIHNGFSYNNKDATFIDSYGNTWDNSYYNHPNRRINFIFGKKTIGSFSVPKINIDRQRRFVTYPISLA
jgi:parallel beta-helix repeat protein